MEQLFALSDDLSHAQASAAGPDLQRLTSLRHELEGTLVRRARSLGEQSGAVSAAMEREVNETLVAALADPAVAAQIRTGRLLKAATYAGFGAFPAPSEGGEAVKPKAASPASQGRPSRGPSSADEARRKQAEQRSREAESALVATKAALAERERALVAAKERHAALQKRTDELEAKLREAVSQLGVARSTVRDAQRHREEAQKRHATAVQDLERVKRSGAAPQVREP
jgi:hypothetical protein